MTTETTDPVRSALGEQLAAFTTAAILAANYPALPGAYAVAHSHIPNRVDFLLEHFSGVEAWREALEVEDSALICRPIGRDTELEFITTVTHETTVQVRVYAIDLVPALTKAVR